MAAIEARLGPGADGGLGQLGKTGRRLGAAVEAQHQPLQDAPLLLVAIVAQGFGQQVGIVNHHQFAIKAAQVGGAQSHLHHPARDIVKAQHLAELEGLLQQDCEVAEKVPGRHLEGKANAQARPGQGTQHGRELQALVLQIHQAAQQPGGAPQHRQQGRQPIQPCAFAQPARRRNQQPFQAPIDQPHHQQQDHQARGGLVELVGLGRHRQGRPAPVRHQHQG